MGKVKKIGILAALAAVAAAAVLVYLYFQTWPLRFRAELDAFFGEGNWEQISAETRESRMYTVTYRRNGLSDQRPGDYHEWDIAFTNRYGEPEVWTISDHTMKINHDKHWILSSDRYSAKQALALELMDVSFSMAAAEVSRELLAEILPEREAECIDVDISYRNGNPPPEMYGKLLRAPCFPANQITAADYLETELYDFYLRFLAFDYRVEKLEEEERQHLMESLDELEQALRETYGDYADYEIYLGEGYKAEYSGALASPQ